MNKKIDVVIKIDIETLKIINRLDFDAGELLAEITKVKLKEWQEKWKLENEESMKVLNDFNEKHGPFNAD